MKDRLISFYTQVVKKLEIENQRLFDTMQDFIQKETEKYERSSIFLNSIPDIIFIFDEDERFIDYHIQDEKLLLFKPEEFLQKRVEDIFPPELSQKIISAFKNLKANDNIQYIEYDLKINKHIKYYEARIVSYQNKNIVIIHDITAQKTIEIALKRKTYELEKTRQLLEETSRVARVGGWELNLKTKELYWSDVTKEIHEVDKDYVPDLNTAIFFYKEGYDRNKIIEIVDRLIHLGIPYVEELQILTAKGKERWVRTIGKSERIDGECVRIFGIFQDIEEQKKTEYKLKDLKEKAEAANQTKSDFLANMSHEIRTPLNGVIGFTELLLKTKLSHTQFEYAKIVQSSANSLHSLINNILDLSKIEAGKLDLYNEKIDIIELLEEAIDVIKIKQYERQIELLLNVPSDLPRFVWVDSLRLRQILLNLLGNAMKFTDKGEIELKVTYLILSDTEMCITFHVRDTGIGIPKAEQKKIYKVFYQAQSVSSDRRGGTGLGLPISNKFLLKMGSHLELESEEGKGSCFYFTLTLPYVNEDKIEFKKIENIRKVLIIDDNESCRKILAELLLVIGIASEECSNGREALSILKEGNKKYDYLFIDYHMSPIDGLELIYRIRNDLCLSSKDIKIALMHNSADSSIISEDLNVLQIQFSLNKPININSLYSKLLNFQKSDFLIMDSNLSNSSPNMKKDRFCKILIAEDTPFNMMLLNLFISETFPKSHILEAQNGKEAVQIYRQEKPDLIFMDILMPEMNGYEATTEIRRIENNQKHIPIIAITAGAIKGEKEHCLEAGMNDYITKPIKMETITQILNKWL